MNKYDEPPQFQETETCAPAALVRNIQSTSHVAQQPINPMVSMESAMNEPRRFDDREIALIFEQASSAQELRADTSPVADGLTLEQLHEIGRDVGLSAEHITRAAHAVTRGDLKPTQKRTWLGLPVAVSRTIEFGRPVSDDEWNGLVTTLRETFDARGKLVTEGAFRQWHNGNLSALLEPIAGGHRLRLFTRKGDARVRVWLGGTYVGIAALIVGLGATGSVGIPGFAGAAVSALAGVAALASAYIGLPKWAKERAEQMESIAARALQPIAPPELSP